MRALSGKRLLRTIRRLVRDRRALSAVEFALIMPIMVTLFIGGTEITQGITIKRKTTIATRTIADLVAQVPTINNSEMSAIFAATGAVLAPYPAAKLKLVISSIAVDQNGNAKVVWSDASPGATARTRNASVTLPTGLNTPNTTLIWAEAEYRYTPTIGSVISGSLDLKDKLYLRPRLVSQVCRDMGAQKYGCS